MKMRAKRASDRELLAGLREGRQLSAVQQMELVWRLSVPAILAQISSIVMQYIDAAMVGQMGYEGSASIGLVSTTTWLFGGMCRAAVIGFSVQVAQAIGAGDDRKASGILRQSLLSAACFGLLLMAAGLAIAGSLPAWLGGEAAIRENATAYFAVFAASIPVMQLNYLAASMLRSSGNMKLPGLLNVIMCALDVCFNFFFIFPVHSLQIAGRQLTIPGMGLGVAGASLGTAMAEAVVAVFMAAAMIREFPLLKKKASWKPDISCIRQAVRIAVPVAAEQVAMCGAQIMTTRIAAPLGAVALAANSFGVTAESFCYMPGYGIAEAATTLVGQCIGAKRKEETRRMARLTVFLGMAVMSASAVLLYFAAPLMFAMLTPVEEVRQLGVRVLRIEMFAEPMFAASIVCSGALRGAGDTLIPSILNLVSMWGVRLTLAVALVPHFGLAGIWIAMCAELCVRGILFLIRLFREAWMPWKKEENGRERERNDE